MVLNVGFFWLYMVVTTILQKEVENITFESFIINEKVFHLVFSNAFEDFRLFLRFYDRNVSRAWRAMLIIESSKLYEYEISLPR